MKIATFIIVFFILLTRYSYSQLSFEGNPVRGYHLNNAFKTWGYNNSVGYLFKKKFQTNIKLEYTNWAWSFYVNDIFYSAKSAQLELRYYMLPIEDAINPYIGIRGCLFEKKEILLKSYSTENWHKHFYWCVVQNT